MYFSLKKKNKPTTKLDHNPLKKIKRFVSLEAVCHMHCYNSHGAEGIKSGTVDKFQWHFIWIKELVAENLQ